MVYSFTKFMEYNKPGVGRIFVINKHDHYEITKVEVGNRVRISGKLYKVTGIEASSRLIYPASLGADYGLIVKPV